MITCWLIKHLDPDWKVAHKLWSIRVALFWAAICGLYVALPSFADWFTPVQFALICMGFSISIVVARLTNQPGVN